MPWCVHCKKITRTERDEEGYLCCTVCGRVIDYANFSNEVTFVKGPGGQSHVSGTFVKSVESDSSSRERTLRKGEDEIRDMVLSLNISEDVVDQASRFYKIAVDRNFTRGRRTSLVAASCVYIVCRENKKPYLLIDFSEYLAVSVYMLGAVFLQLCQLLRLEEHPIFQKLVDPSLFIHRFTERLLGCKNAGVSRDALRIVASMKRDWMQTGRKPSGLCGAALYISAFSHGLKYSKADVVSVVHVCEATLTKRLIEFENTESGSLTIEEFNMKAEELEREGVSRQQPNPATKSSGLTELLCQHKGTSNAHFAHGLCKACYDDFIIISGGLQGGSEPPAFQRAERDRMAKAAAEEKSKESSISEEELEPPSKHNRHVNENDKRESSPSSGATIGNQAVDDGAFGQPLGNEDMDNEDMDAGSGGESESLSDIDDAELDGYLNNKEEQCKKKIIWEEMNKEYLEEQAAKEAAAAAAREAYEANFQNCSEESLAARELAAATAAAVAKNRKERKRKRDAEAKNASPPQTAAEAAQEMFTRKRISSKINYDILKKLLNGDSMDSENTKKKRVEPDAIDRPTKEGNEEEPESDLVDNDDTTLQEDDYGEEGYGEETYGHGNDSYYGNEEEGYGYDGDYGYEEY